VRRRTFLVTIGAAAALGGGGLVLVFRRAGDAGPVLGGAKCEGGKTLSVRLADVLPRPGGVRRIGRAVLAGERIRPGRDELAERLFAGDAWSRACRDGARATLQSAIRTDFRDDRTVTLGGWVLSRTEADLYALAELVLSSA
jgi:hypothetical protein